jgi:hypothetical protein
VKNPRHFASEQEKAPRENSKGLFAVEPLREARRGRAVEPTAGTLGEILKETEISRSGGQTKWPRRFARAESLREFAHQKKIDESAIQGE